MTDMGTLLDHDLLIGLRAELTGLRQIVEAHNIGSVERDTEVKTLVKEINGTVKRHDAALVAHAGVPHSAVDHATSVLMIDRMNEMWVAWSVGKWVGAAAALALIGQTAALLVVVVRMM